MEEKTFLDKKIIPTDESLEQALGVSFPFYQRVVSLAGGFYHEWNYTKSGGWMLKVHDKKKALFYVIPLKNEFKISMAIREAERDALVIDPELISFHNALKTAKKYVEGYALQFKISNDSEYLNIELFIKKLTAIRLG